MYFVFEPLDSWLSLVLAVGLGLYFFAGLFTHLQLDNNIQLLWSDDDRDFPDHTRYFRRLNSDYLFLSSVFVVWGLSTFRAALPIMLILIFGYTMIVVGRVLPEIDREFEVDPEADYEAEFDRWHDAVDRSMGWAQSGGDEYSTPLGCRRGTARCVFYLQPGSIDCTTVVEW